ncbi:DsbA family protein [Streptomyces alkaliphilus]|uniref:DsbA family protein n=1 Tax=Streptomyces alkaliphilus TaxID=1472722 RepID=UPI00117EE957|nr:thioredoxin domain-containing protein [Streptomyces alkaliphilus]MQS06428.1 thioredoxin domain-containing protein [Streptomyces alkaliphilus]
MFTGRNSRRNRSVVVIALATLVVGAMVISGMAGLFAGAGGSSEPTAPTDAAEGPGDTDAVTPIPGDHPIHTLARRDGDDPLAIGEPDAPIVMLMYADFQCAVCGRWVREIEPALIDEYVDAGDLRIEFRNFPIHGPESDLAARAARAAGEQGRFREFYEAAYAVDTHRDSGRFSEEGVVGLAREAGVPDLDRFVADLDREEIVESVARDAEEAGMLGVAVPPSFLINGHAVVGAQPADTFRDTIDPLLAAAR